LLVTLNDWRHQQNLNASKTLGDKIKVVFFGDSITEGWNYDTGAPVWKKHYEPLPAVNYGVGAERTEHVIWHIQNGEVDGIHPKAVVVMIGTNNIQGQITDDDVVHGITAVIDNLKTKLPSTKILQLGILPRGRDDAMLKRIDNINSQVSKISGITFLNMKAKFTDSSGHLIESLFTDLLHLTTAGYEVWAAAMNPTLSTLIGSTIP